MFLAFLPPLLREMRQKIVRASEVEQRFVVVRQEEREREREDKRKGNYSPSSFLLRGERRRAGKGTACFLLSFA